MFVTGITEEQATKELLTYILYSSNKEINGTFSCDNDIINKIQQATLNSDLSNIFYFPTDCPQREKNGWTADASLSAEQMLINIKPENCYKEWLRNIYKAMLPSGQLPGIVPTASWGYEWGNGPAWDIVIVNLPYYTYIYRGEIEILKESAEPIYKYIKYLDSKLNENNLLEIGLGDWCEPDKDEWEFTTPLIVTDSITSVDISRKAQFIFETLGLESYREFAKAFENKLVKAIKENLIDHTSMTVHGNTQTAQTMGLYYGLFEENEYKTAFNNLLRLLNEKGNHCYCGVVGANAFYELLAKNGYIDLAIEIITSSEFPSYGNWIKRGATSLWETFRRENDTINSLNHHFWGFVSAFFYKYIAGFNINPAKNDKNTIDIVPLFPKQINYCHSTYNTSSGEVIIDWKKENNSVDFGFDIPCGITAILKLNNGITKELIGKSRIKFEI